MSFTWQNGRQLASITQNGSTLATYTYNADGLRTSKTVNGTKTDYYWMNGTLQGQKTGDTYLFFLYDESGRIFGFVEKTSTGESYYYYEFNLQGDIIGIINSAGTRVVEYTYGAWGDLLSVTGSLASTLGQTNPLRYRGYYYDAETGFYATGTRYYDPEVERFISPDTIAVLTATPMGLTDKNLYAYCDNNPIVRADNGGQFWHIVAGAAIGFASQYVANVVGGLMDGESLGDALKIRREDIPGLIGASISGALTATGISAAGLMVANATINASTYAIECDITGKEINQKELVMTVGIGMIFDVGGGANVKKMSGIIKTANKYIATSSSAKKIAMYTAKKTMAKKTMAKKTITKSVAETFVGSVISNNAYSSAIWLKRLAK